MSWSAAGPVSLAFEAPSHDSLIDMQNPGIRFLLVACPCLFVGVQLMFEYRYVRSFMNTDDR
jgi:hypothetical protein